MNNPQNPEINIDQLPPESRQRIQETLRSALQEELANQGPTLGLQPGSAAAVSSSVGQSISFGKEADQISIGPDQPA